MRAIQEGRIPNAPLREAVQTALADGLTLSEICYRIGWLRKTSSGALSGTNAETAGLQRALGIQATRYKNRKTGVGGETYVCSIDVVRANAIAQAIDVDIDELYDGKLPAEKVAGLCRECDAPMLRPVPDGLCGLCAEELALFGRIAVAA